jgi:hypothetical protein
LLCGSLTVKLRYLESPRFLNSNLGRLQGANISTPKFARFINMDTRKKKLAKFSRNRFATCCSTRTREVSRACDLRVTFFVIVELAPKSNQASRKHQLTFKRRLFKQTVHSGITTLQRDILEVIFPNAKKLIHTGNSAKSNVLNNV